MPLNTQIDIKNPSAFTIRNHAFGARPATTGIPRSKTDTLPTQSAAAQSSGKPA